MWNIYTLCSILWISNVTNVIFKHSEMRIRMGISADDIRKYKCEYWKNFNQFVFYHYFDSLVDVQVVIVCFI